jgi:hypothetical protein
MLGGVYRIGLPRTDLKVLLDVMELKPALALGSWLAFRSEGIRRWSWAIADEVTPVMRKLAGRDRDHGVAQPSSARRAGHVVYMHVLGRGDPVKLAAALHDGLALSKMP